MKYIPSINSDKEQVISVEVQITPYFWKSWWFVALIIIGIIALLQYAYVRRLNKMREEEVEALYRPIEAAMKESDEPEKLQSRIQMILQNQKRYQDSQKKSIEADRKMVEETMRPFMEEVMDVMEKNYDNSEFGVQELADALGVSRSVLSKNLSKETGLPTAQFIRNYRLDISRKMMADKTSNRNITEIAYRVGFNDQSISPVASPSSLVSRRLHIRISWILRVQIWHSSPWILRRNNVPGCDNLLSKQNKTVGLLDISQVTPCFVCVGTQLVDKHVISLKIHCLCGLSTYKTQLSTQYNPVNCTFATEI